MPTLNTEDLRLVEACPKCADWGRTLTDPMNLPAVIIYCPGCGRPTWPNLGVNVPAGAAWGLAGSACVRMLQ